jgi:hypothetical protein
MPDAHADSPPQMVAQPPQLPGTIRITQCPRISTLTTANHCFQLLMFMPISPFTNSDTYAEAGPRMGTPQCHLPNGIRG